MRLTSCLFSALLILLAPAGQARSSLPIAHYFYDLYVGPHGEILAAQNFGLFRTTDDGDHWIRVRDLDTTPVIRLFDAGKYGVFAESPMGLYRSVDAGERWTRVADDFFAIEAIDQTGTMYGWKDTDFPGEFCVSKDLGKTWRTRALIPVLPIGGDFQFRKILHMRKALYAFSGKEIYRSIDTGRIWDQVSAPVLGPREYISDMHNDSEGKLYLSILSSHGLAEQTRDYVFRSADRGRHWQRLSFGLDPDAINARISRIDKTTLHMSCSIKAEGAWPRKDSLCDSDGGTSLAVIYDAEDNAAISHGHEKIGKDGRRYTMGQTTIFSSDASGRRWRKLGVTGLPHPYTGEIQQ